MDKKSVVEIVNEKIISKLEAGVNPWVKPWTTSGGMACNKAMNYISNKAYNGINHVLLDPGYYLTFKQIQDIGGTLRKGAKAQIVVYSKVHQYKTTEKDPDGKDVEVTKKGFILQYYYVFRLDDLEEGYHQIKNRNSQEETGYFETAEDEDIESIIRDYCSREHLTVHNIEQDRAYYRPSADEIVMPQIKQFKSKAEYYGTLFHELGHSTGHPSRLNREGISGWSFFGTETYSKEELIAEITSAYSLNHLGIQCDATDTNNIAYLQNWASHLKGNTANWFVINATTQAEKAYKLIFNIKESNDAEGEA